MFNKFERFMLMLIVMICSFSIAYAENPAADKYRQLFADGDYYIEYEIMPDASRFPAGMFKNLPRQLHVFAMYNGKIKVMGNYSIDPYSSKSSKQADIPVAFYENGDLYGFESAKKAYIYKGYNGDISAVTHIRDTKQLHIMSQAEREIDVPVALKMFTPKTGTYDDNNPIERKPEYISSYSVNEGGITYDVDEYENSFIGYSMVNMTNNQGTKFTTTYKLYYIGNELKKAQVISNNYKQEFVFSAIRRNVDERFVSIPTGCTVYAVAIDDMDGLLGNERIAEHK